MTIQTLYFSLFYVKFYIYKKIVVGKVIIYAYNDCTIIFLSRCQKSFRH